MNRQKRKGARTHSSPDHSCVRASRAPRLTFSRQKSGGVLQEFLWKKIRANDTITSLDKKSRLKGDESLFKGYD